MFGCPFFIIYGMVRPNILKVMERFTNIPINYPLHLGRPVYRIIAFIDINIDT